LGGKLGTTGKSSLRELGTTGHGQSTIGHVQSTIGGGQRELLGERAKCLAMLQEVTSVPAWLILVGSLNLGGSAGRGVHVESGPFGLWVVLPRKVSSKDIKHTRMNQKHSVSCMGMGFCHYISHVSIR
jgi:hypothetical protein